MAAEILEAQPEDTHLDELPTDQAAMSSAEVATSFEGVDSTEAPQGQEDGLPDKYRGKSIQEVVSMHQEAERLIGSQGSEVGELRKVVDGYIHNQLNSQPAAEPEPEIDFFEDPKEAVNRAIETHPEVVQARQAAQNMERSASVQQLQAKHPDMAQVLQDPSFNTWVQGSPMRQEMFARADKQYDFNAADELISTYKERATVAQQAVQTETAARQQAVRQASTGSATGANTSGAKRVYRRADIIKLMKNDPDRYEALSTEIMQAYAEGRVR